MIRVIFMKGRNIFGGLSLLALAGCDFPKSKSWVGQVSSAPGYNVSVSQTKRGDRVAEHTLNIRRTKDSELNVFLHAVDGNGNGKFGDYVDQIKTYGNPSSSDPLLVYKDPQRLELILSEALPNAINNPAYTDR